eukprot:IDg18290t1
MTSCVAAYLNPAGLFHVAHHQIRSTCRRRRAQMCVGPASAQAPDTAAKSLDNTESTAKTFAVDAGRDLFFTGMDETMAIDILQKPLGSLPSPDDRYIAAERLKFFVTEASARALMEFVHRFASLDAAVEHPPWKNEPPGVNR